MGSRDPSDLDLASRNKLQSRTRYEPLDRDRMAQILWNVIYTVDFVIHEHGFLKQKGMDVSISTIHHDPTVRACSSSLAKSTAAPPRPTEHHRTGTQVHEPGFEQSYTWRKGKANLWEGSCRRSWSKVSCSRRAATWQGRTSSDEQLLKPRCITSTETTTSPFQGTLWSSSRPAFATIANVEECPRQRASPRPWRDPSVAHTTLFSAEALGFRVRCWHKLGEGRGPKIYSPGWARIDRIPIPNWTTHTPVGSCYRAGIVPPSTRSVGNGRTAEGVHPPVARVPRRGWVWQRKPGFQERRTWRCRSTSQWGIWLRRARCSLTRRSRSRPHTWSGHEGAVRAGEGFRRASGGGPRESKGDGPHGAILAQVRYYCFFHFHFPFEFKYVF
jgi:hypothetical protein